LLSARRASASKLVSLESGLSFMADLVRTCLV
jgi:hypothetical protein